MNSPDYIQYHETSAPAGPSWTDGIHRFVSRYVSLDPGVWIGRILVTLAIVAAFDAYEAYERRRSKREHEEFKEQHAWERELLQEPEASDSGRRLVEMASQQELRSFLQTREACVIVFSAYWCGPCQRSKPKLEALARSTETPFKMGLVHESDVDDRAIQRFQVTMYPTYILVGLDGREVDRVEGVDLYAVKTMMQEYAKTIPASQPITTTTEDESKPSAKEESQGSSPKEEIQVSSETATESTGQPFPPFASTTAPDIAAASVKTETKTAPTPKATAKATTATNSFLPTGSNDHPGMDGFGRWYEVETSLYRIYTRAHTDPNIPAVPPYVPHSHRGRVSLELEVANRTDHDLNVYWVDHSGNLVPKGQIPRHHGVWHQTTWIDHPWVFENARTQTPYLYFVPYRVIPTLPEAPTVASNGTTGLHKFAIVEPDDDYHIGVADEIMPHPAGVHFDTPLKGITWTLRHLSRANESTHKNTMVPLADLLQKYLLNIVNHPENWKYRNLRLAAPKIQSIWNSPLRGLLLAVGFVEQGAYCWMGRSDAPLPPDRVQEVALLSYLLNEWKVGIEGGSASSGEQPAGAADGFGRAGFGRAGTMH